MDIVTRLKEYIEHTGMPVTQFADTAAIPRPTLSQILSGRNRKISNEILDKLHNGFPNLNIMWLMFGDGNMEIVSTPAPIQATLDIDDQSTDIQFAAHAKEDQEEDTKESPAPLVDENSKVSLPSQIGLSVESGKKIQNIMVFYTDNSYEIFIPANR